MGGGGLQNLCVKILIWEVGGGAENVTGREKMSSCQHHYG